ncbi:PREDICTED: serpin-ZXA-like [Nicotiana attenuata]|uniref:serpin-ZXA-like n=1 Tax=Nicotiana attenuata TaxID=49451 RepID=UPI000905D7F9|nr:PREDICTED: serpin-ZXA-like [Nicotiana attenuata]
MAVQHHLPSKTADVRRRLIPKFKITFGFEATEVLIGLGLAHPFYGNGLAEIVDDNDTLFVAKVFHKSFIEVNEEGTEAAAVTAATMMIGCSGVMIKEEPIDFVADHPFLFLVKDDATGVVLFIGTLLNPLNQF